MVHDWPRQRYAVIFVVEFYYLYGDAMNEAVIVGEAVAGESAKIRRRVDAVLKTINTSVFDAAELLAKVKVNKLYTSWGFNTLSEYFDSLDISVRKAQYLSCIGEVMSHPKINIPRADYEPVGIAKLREICSLNPESVYRTPEGEDVPMADYIRGFIYDRVGDKIEAIQRDVRILKGLIGENEQARFTLMVSRLVLEQVINPAIEKLRLELGPVGKDEDGMAVEASAGRCIELICAKYLTEEIDDDVTVDVSNDVSQLVGERYSSDLLA